MVILLIYQDLLRTCHNLEEPLPSESDVLKLPLEDFRIWTVHAEPIVAACPVLEELFKAIIPGNRRSNTRCIKVLRCLDKSLQIEDVQVIGHDTSSE